MATGGVVGRGKPPVSARIVFGARCTSDGTLFSDRSSRGVDVRSGVGGRGQEASGASSPTESRGVASARISGNHGLFGRSKVARGNGRRGAVADAAVRQKAADMDPRAARVRDRQCQIDFRTLGE